MSTPSPELPFVRLTDTTLRDGSHAMRHRFTEEQVRTVTRALDASGIQVIEVTHGDGLGGSSFNYGFSLVDELTLVRAAVAEAERARIAVLLLPGLGTIDDLRAAHDAGASVARIATHCTEADVSSSTSARPGSSGSRRSASSCSATASPPQSWPGRPASWPTRGASASTSSTRPVR